MGSDRDPAPELTATAADSASPAAEEAVGGGLGRYRLGSELGRGAIGVVYAAFDPDLERMIALKVLRRATGAQEAKERLLREARAMARLAHPNVMSVHEVGTAGGRDFVAMELVHGETLAAWLRSRRRPLDAILAAFLAAGRGLAAAHAAGIVHRDFKPGNVLRSSDGRIVVTDFGLARRAEDSSPELGVEPVVPELPPDAASLPATLTMPGELLGTPPYMAPEQWHGGPITPATDQFAFCVALWEAITGERPYRGDREEIREQILRGPGSLDHARIPRRFRRALRRGLDPDPARRWPRMDALLAQIERAPVLRRTSLIAAASVAAIAVLLLRSTSPVATDATAATCTSNGRDVASVWSSAIAETMRKQVSAANVDALDAAFRDWQKAHERACAAPARVSSMQLLCLDAVLERFEVLRRAMGEAQHAVVPDEVAEELRAQLVDPGVCLQPRAADVPNLSLVLTQNVIAAYTLLARSETEHKPDEREILALLEHLESDGERDACARVVAALAFSAVSNDARRVHALLNAAGPDNQTCHDARVNADFEIRDIAYHWEWPIGGPQAENAIRGAETAAGRVTQPELAAELAAARRTLARQRRQWDEAFRDSDLELAALGGRGLPRRWLGAVIARNELRLVRSEPHDLDDVIVDAMRWWPTAMASQNTELAAALHRQAGEAAFWRSDTAAAAAWSRSWRDAPRDEAGPARMIEGTVVDDRGEPVAGATVAGANLLRATSFDIGSPLSNVEGGMHVATTDGAGRFAIIAPPHIGVIVATRGDQRSKPLALANGVARQEPVTLSLEPTRRVSGTVELHGTPYTQVYVRCADADDHTGRFRIIAAVRADATFVIDGASLGEVRIGVATKADAGIDGRVDFETLPASPAAVTDLRLAVPVSARTVDVTVVSAVAERLDGAQVVVVPGHLGFRTFGDIIESATASRFDQFAVPIGGGAGLAAHMTHPGRLAAHLEHVAPGEITVCAMGFTSELLYPEVRARMQDHVTELALECKQLGPDGAEVEIKVPPQQRFD